MNSPEIACGINVYCTGPDAADLPSALDDMAELGYSHIALSPISEDATDVAGQLMDVLEMTDAEPPALHRRVWSWKFTR